MPHMAVSTTQSPIASPPEPGSTGDVQVALHSTPTHGASVSWARAYFVMFAIYFGLGMAVRLAGWIHGDADWFVEAARRVLDGSFDVYGFRSAPEVVPPLGATYAYSPLTAIIIAPFVWIADIFRWDQGGAERLISIPLLVADILAMDQLRRLVRAWRPAVDERLLLAGIAVTLFLTGLLSVSAFYTHNSGLMLFFLLLALRFTPTNLLAGGVFAGLAIATKQTTLLNLIPIGLVLLLTNRGLPGHEGFRGGPLYRALIWSGAAVAVFLAILLPAIIRSPSDVYYALVTQIALLTPFGPGLPVWLDFAGQRLLDPSEYASFRPALLNYSNWFLFGSVAFLSALAIRQVRKRGRPIGLADARLLALVAFAAAAQIALGKWVSGHYYQLPLALVFLWDIVRGTPRTTSTAQGLSRSLDLFPWAGFGAAVAFRSITQLGIAWIKDLLLLGLFAGLALYLLSEARRAPESET